MRRPRQYYDVIRGVIRRWRVGTASLMMRPVCPSCQRELVFVCIVLSGSGEFFRSWQCDCDYRTSDGEAQEDTPKDIIATIVRAREDNDGSITYEWGTIVNDDTTYGNI